MAVKFTVSSLFFLPSSLPSSLPFSLFYFCFSSFFLIFKTNFRLDSYEGSFTKLRLELLFNLLTLFALDVILTINKFFGMYDVNSSPDFIFLAVLEEVTK